MSARRGRDVSECQIGHEVSRGEPILRAVTYSKMVIPAGNPSNRTLSDPET